jgi:hypothetical protein
MAKLSVHHQVEAGPASSLSTYQNTLYKITGDIVPIQDRNPTIIAVGPLLNFRAEECFDSEPTALEAKA